MVDTPVSPATYHTYASNSVEIERCAAQQANKLTALNTKWSILKLYLASPR